ncbi:MAG TPA: prephenate dehydratase domain-containing protein [Candidatus Saccharimonadales bacterium]|nr:prephenate dehydratase domain-containing protein [Candidatus Saccharimonadales bacterium]
MDLPEDLRDLRARIDRIDRELVRLLGQRAEAAAQVGRVKAGAGDTVFDPGREEAVIARAVELGAGPLPARAVEAVFREIISASRALEAPTRIAYLGEEGGFGHEAAAARFGSSAFCVPMADADALLSSLQARGADFGSFPITPSGEDPGFEAFDLLLNSPFPVVGEFLAETSHWLLVPGAEPVRRLFGDPFAFTHCRRHLDQRCPGAERVAVRTGLEAARLAAHTPGAAAVGARSLGELAGLAVAGEMLDDVPAAARRYLILGSEPAPRAPEEKTSLLVALANRPGTLHHLLGCFASAGANVAWLENRAHARWPWDHLFCLEVEGHQSEEPLRGALQRARAATEFFKVLGSFPRAAAR